MNKNITKLLSEGLTDSLLLLNKLKNKYETEESVSYFRELTDLPNDFTKETLFNRLNKIINKILKNNQDITKEYVKYVINLSSDFYDQFYNEIVIDINTRQNTSKRKIWLKSKQEVYYYTMCFILVGLQVNNVNKLKNMYDDLIEILNKTDMGEKHFKWSVILLIITTMINFIFKSVAILVNGAFLYVFASIILLVVNEIRAYKKDKTLFNDEKDD